MAEPPENPYIGPRPFERDDVPFFFGREGEQRELVSLVVAERVVLLYAASGAGKSSLLSAGVIPLLEAEEGFDVPRIARVRAPAADETLANARNVYMFGVLSGWDAPMEEALRVPLVEFLADRPRRRDSSGLDAPCALIFDQFEELFSLYPAYWQQRTEFFEQVEQALASDPLLRVVFAIREDYIAELDPYSPTLLGGLRARFRLERLGAEQALQAVVEPARKAKRGYAEGVAEKLVAELLKFRVDTGGRSAEVQGEFVEPVQLQVVCQSLWSELPTEVEEITADHVRRFGDVDEVLRRFYDDAVRAAATAAHLRERKLRDLIQSALITSVGTRSTIYRTTKATASIPNAAIDELENRHLIRAEWRAGARWYELTHDRFIEPIESSNDRFRRALRRRQRRSAFGALVVFVIVGSILWATSSGTQAVKPNVTLAIEQATLNVTQSAYFNLIGQSGRSPRVPTIRFRT